MGEGKVRWFLPHWLGHIPPNSGGWHRRPFLWLGCRSVDFTPSLDIANIVQYEPPFLQQYERTPRTAPSTSRLIRYIPITIWVSGSSSQGRMPGHAGLVIWGNDRPKFGEPDKANRDKRVCVTGKIINFRGTPEIAASDPAEIEVQR